MRLNTVDISWFVCRFDPLMHEHTPLFECQTPLKYFSRVVTLAPSTVCYPV